MDLKNYLWDKSSIILIFCIEEVIKVFLCNIFRLNSACCISIVFISILSFLIVMVLDFRKKREFYNDVIKKMNMMDKKNLIYEMIEEPNFLEGKILYDISYELCKESRENFKERRKMYDDFKEYIEMWIHEIKVSISGLSIINYNLNQTSDILQDWYYENICEELEYNENKNVEDIERNIISIKQDTEKQLIFIKKLDGYVEQILYYSRAEKSSEDYILKKNNLEKIVNKVIIANKILLINGKIKIEKKSLDIDILTDFKWFEFILGQIVNNAIKYTKKDNKKIVFSAVESEKKIMFSVTDYGIGISKQDIERVFDKTFTGENGRIDCSNIAGRNSNVSGSTGMGLYICKKMCNMLGHKIFIKSEKNRYTTVSIEIGKDEFYEEVR